MRSGWSARSSRLWVAAGLNPGTREASGAVGAAPLARSITLPPNALPSAFASAVVWAEAAWATPARSSRAPRIGRSQVMGAAPVRGGQGGAAPAVRLGRCHRGRSRGPAIGRAHVRTPVTNAHLVCRLLLEKKNKNHTKPLIP